MTPVKYSAGSVTLVQNYEALPAASKTASYWSEAVVSGVRKEIKDHYIREQSYRCCYCQHVIDSPNNAVWDAEHVISRSARPEFMFEPLNLAVACKDCNLAKLEENVLKNPKRKTFPKKSDDYLIVHPHFDDYDDHILWFGPVVSPTGIGSGKGTATIVTCKLYRYAARNGNLKGDIGDRRFRNRVGELITARSQSLAREVLAEIGVQVVKLPDR